MDYQKTNALVEALLTSGMTKKDVAEMTKNSAGVLDYIRGKKPSILDFVSITDVPATTSKFVANQKFVVNTESNAPVRIGLLGENFRFWFGDKTEDPRNETSIQAKKLNTESMDYKIIQALGGQKKAETTLSELFYLIEQQGGGKKGILLTNGYGSNNIFYIRGVFGRIHTVYVRWYSDGWHVRAVADLYPHTWDDGGQVFSRNS